MGVKIVKMEDKKGNKIFINPASVCSIAEQENWEKLDGEPEKIVHVNCYGYCYVVSIPISEVKELVWGGE